MHLKEHLHARARSFTPRVSRRTISNSGRGGGGDEREERKLGLRFLYLRAQIRLKIEGQAMALLFDVLS
jgi:hypothetical protein